MNYIHETVKVPDQFLAWIYLHSENRITSVAKHWHRSLEISYIREGTSKYDINGHQFIASAGELILINSGEVHGCEMNYFTTEAISVIFPFSFLKQIFPNIEDICFILNQEDPGYASLIHAFNEIYPVVKSREGNTFYALKLNSFFYEILYILLTRFQVQRSVLSSIKTQKYMERCSKIIAYIDERYKEPITLDTVAREYSISKEHLARTFKECMGTTFKTYLTSIRMHHAYQALMDSDLPIIQIALDHGFSDSRAFTSAFRHYYGDTPQNYRRQSHSSTSHQKEYYLRTHGTL